METAPSTSPASAAPQPQSCGAVPDVPMQQTVSEKVTKRTSEEAC